MCSAAERWRTCPGSCGLTRFGKHLCQLLGQYMLSSASAGLEYLKYSFNAVDEMMYVTGSLPWSSMASKPVELQEGSESPPTLLSMTESVWGDMLTTCGLRSMNTG